MLMPEVIYIETTSVCNAKCIMCPHEQMERKQGTMSDLNFETTINGMKDIDLTNLTLFLHKEGEPLLDRKLVDRIKYVKANLKGIKEVIINTNASRLTEEVAIGLLNSGLDKIYFSLDGASPDTYNKIRINLDYNKVVANIENFFLLKEKLKSNIQIIIQMVVSDDNRHEVDLYNEKWGKEDCQVYIKPMHCYLDGGRSSFLQINSTKQLNVCEDPFRMMVVYSNGDIGICCWDYDNEYKIGNVQDDSLLNLFNNKKFNYLREMQSKKECGDIAPCNRCMRIYGNDEISKTDRNLI
tara:strand:- start:1069 stop:1956 length:888 start_codon:yes stop_codon:yes gene_type:complete